MRPWLLWSYDAAPAAAVADCGCEDGDDDEDVPVVAMVIAAVAAAAALLWQKTPEKDYADDDDDEYWERMKFLFLCLLLVLWLAMQRPIQRLVLVKWIAYFAVLVLVVAFSVCSNAVESGLVPNWFFFASLCV